MCLHDVVAQVEECAPASNHLGECQALVILGHIVEEDAGGLVGSRVRHDLPDLLGGEAEDGGYQAGQHRDHGVHSGLPGAAGCGLLAVGIGVEAPAENVVFISAKTGQGIEQMLELLEGIVSVGKRRVTYFVPNSDGGALNTLYRMATVESVEYGAEGMTVVALVDAKVRGMMRRYAVDDLPESEDE